MRRSYKILKSKVKKRLALIILQKATSQQLDDFLTSLKHGLELSITNKFPQEQEAPFKPENNLFEGFSAMDLSFLKGCAVIIPKDQVKGHIIEDMIMYFEPSLASTVLNCESVELLENFDA